jgi:uncharacterized protein YbbC (DUF1343 family)
VILPAALLAASVLVGLDVVDADAGRPLAGKRVGLVVHAASVSADGRQAVDVLRARGVTVVRLFAPEHGLRGEAAAGQEVAAGRDAASALPVVSLYGARRAPAPADLRDLDALVVDLQDAGVRFYTYESTLLLCLEAAAAAGVELVVLDRPNPLGGERVAGPVSENPTAFLSMAPGPLLHGLTLGELARLANAERARPARLTVVAMRGWQRPMTWAETGRAWVPPSPNLRTAEAALAYPGIALLEATNVSEGRGTDAPFLRLGAPWLTAWTPPPVAGYAFEPTRFTPAAPEPKLRGVACVGSRVSVTDPVRADPWRLGLSLLRALRAEPGFAWLREGAALDTLLGTPRIRQGIEAGLDVEALIAADRDAAEAFRRRRSAVLLY